MYRIEKGITQSQQLQPLDIIFSVSDNLRPLDQLQLYLQSKYIQKYFPKMDPVLSKFNQVRMFWGHALMKDKLLSLEWTRIPFTFKYRVKVAFLSDWIIDPANAWIMRHPTIIKNGISNREFTENVIGKWYSQETSTHPSKDIFAIFQRAGYPLPGAVTSQINITSLLLTSKLVWANS